MTQSIQEGRSGAVSSAVAVPHWITDGGLCRATLRLAIPTLGTMLLHNLFHLVDMYFLGILGSTAVAAVGMSGPALNLVYVVVMGVTTGCTALVAQAMGSGVRERAQYVAGQSLLTAGVLSLTVAAFGVPLAGRFLEALGAETAVVAAGTPYLRILSGFSFALILSITFSSAIRGAGDAKTPLKVMGAAAVLNIALDPMMIFGHPWLPWLPAMGVTGSAVATALSQLLAMCWLAWLFLVKGHEHFYLNLGHLRPRLDIIKQVFRIGVFSSGQGLIRSLASVALVWIVAKFGKSTMAAFTIGLRLWMLVLMIGIAFGIAAATMVGQNLGAHKPDRAARAGWVTAGLAAALSLLVAAAFLVWNEQLVRVFNSEPAVVAAGSEFLRWLAAAMAFLTVSVVLSRAMSGAGDTFLPMLVTAVTMLGLGLPLAFGLARAWNSVTGVWVAIMTYTIIHGVLIAATFWWGRWKAVGRGFIDAAALAAVAAEE